MFRLKLLKSRLLRCKKIGDEIAEITTQSSEQSDNAKKKKKKKLSAPPIAQKSKGAKTVALSPFSPLGRLNYGFVSCSHCSHFISGYRKHFGEPSLIALAEATMASDWLELSWNNDLARIVFNSYGFELPEGVETWEGSCPLCRRAYFYEQGSAETLATFHIQIIPKLRN